MWSDKRVIQDCITRLFNQSPLSIYVDQMIISGTPIIWDTIRYSYHTGYYQVLISHWILSGTRITRDNIRYSYHTGYYQVLISHGILSGPRITRDTIRYSYHTGYYQVLISYWILSGTHIMLDTNYQILISCWIHQDTCWIWVCLVLSGTNFILVAEQYTYLYVYIEALILARTIYNQWQTTTTLNKSHKHNDLCHSTHCTSIAHGLS